MADSYSIADFRRDIRQPYAWPGGYPRFFLTNDGAALSFAAAKERRRDILESIRDDLRDGWRVVACPVNEENSGLTCDHTGAAIPSAYGDDDDDAAPFKVEGVETEDGSRTELGAFASSGEAGAFLSSYTSREDAGGWNLIEVYDTRGADAERLAYWERGE